MIRLGKLLSNHTHANCQVSRQSPSRISRSARDASPISYDSTASQSWRLIRDLAPLSALPRALVGTPPYLDNGGISWEEVRLLPRFSTPPTRRCANPLFRTEESPIKDKTYRRYALAVEKTLALFETALEEWADYIAFLNKLLKVGEHASLISRAH